MTRRNLYWVGAGAALVAVFCIVLLVQRSEPPIQQLPEFRSYFMDPQFVDSAFGSAGDVPPVASASMVLVNHHLLGARLIARALERVATDEPVTVVLISPDHFGRGAAPATSVVARWPTPYGTLEPAAEDIKRLSDAGVVNLQAAPFALEHGITNVTMFIAHAMPNAKLVPIIVRESAQPSSMDALADAVMQLPGRVLVVGSFDFTHEATDAVARANDARSVRILTVGDPTAADGIAIDSVPGIRLLMRIAQLRNLRFTLEDSTNSARITGNLAQKDVTSYITGTWAP